MKYESKEHQRQVEDTVKKVCGYGTCFCGYDCGHTNKAPRVVPIMGTETMCPLAEFHVEPDGRSYFDRAPEENALSLEDLWEVCYACPHATVSGDLVTLTDFSIVCLDCPIQAVRETLNECEAESRC